MCAMRRGYHRPLPQAREKWSFARVMPGVALLRTYRVGWLRGDVLAGVTVAAYLVPQVMAYAQIAGLPPAIGLLAMVGPTVAYFLFGSSRRLSVGPESTTALMTAAAVAAVGVSGPEEYASLAAAFAIVTGILCLVGWFARLGFLADLLSHPVLIGYMAGIAFLMMVSQITRLTGIPTEGDSTLMEAWSALQGMDQVHWPTLALGVALLVMLLVGAKFVPKVPHPLFVVLIGAAAVAWFDLDRYGIQTVGALPDVWSGISLPRLSLSDIAMMLGPALGIAVVGYSDNVLTARAFAAKGEHIDDNQEFLALGAANIAAGATGGFPVSSSGSRTAIGASLNSHTQVYSLVAVGSMVLFAVFGSPVLAAFPQAALAALVFYAAFRLIEVGEFRRIAAFRLSELVLCVATVVAVLALGALNGILVAVGLSIADMLRRVARPHDAILGHVPRLAGMHDIDDYPEAVQVPGLVFYRYDSPLFFANADDLRTRALKSVDEVAAHTPVHWFLMNMEANVEVDLTSLDSLALLIDELTRRGIDFGLARVKIETRDDLEAAGLLEVIGEDMIFPTLPTALEAYDAWRRQHGLLPEEESAGN
jgi:SulP family sulfate permease